jgi:hypothetical protein
LLAAFCLSCLSPALAQTFESVLAPGPLIKAHVKAEHDCEACHVRFNKAGQDAQCLKCHKDVNQDITEHKGWHGRQKLAACRTCHTDHRGRDAKVAEFDKKSFDHKLTDFTLRQRHLEVDCAKCHPPGKRWREASNECHICHRADDVHRNGLGSACADCHNERKWKETAFDHNKKTKFELDGKHTSVKCEDCHKNGHYKDTAKTCISCHKKDDEHKGRYGDKCENCHVAKDWKTLSFDHDTDTKYALRGKHRSTKCNECHTGPVYKAKLDTECVACHRKDDKHKESLGRDCGACHTERNWKEPARFDHDKTKFPLLGKHVKTECKECHREAEKDRTKFSGAPTDCYACHKKDDKHEGTLGQKCGSCHGEKDWKSTQGKFDHQKTKFPLREAHAAAKVKCGDCHKDAKSYRDIPSDCLACHKKDDKHEGTLGKDCANCHTEKNWKTTQGRFDHDKTKFQLRNAHAAAKVKCQDCHRDAKNMRNTPKDCVSCHRKDDKHEGNLGMACEQCHSDRDWKVPGFDHNRSRFALTGRHINTKCKDCHENLKYRDTSRECFSCHKKEDKHKARLGAACGECHNARAWSLWTYDHDKRTKYPLEAAHKKVACEACHLQAAPAGKAIAPVGTDCYSCHRKADVHEGSFGRRCEMCHAPDDWRRVRRPGGASPLPSR